MQRLRFRRHVNVDSWKQTTIFMKTWIRSNEHLNNEMTNIIYFFITVYKILYFFFSTSEFAVRAVNTRNLITIDKRTIKLIWKTLFFTSSHEKTFKTIEIYIFYKAFWDSWWWTMGMGLARVVDDIFSLLSSVFYFVIFNAQLNCHFTDIKFFSLKRNTIKIQQSTTNPD